MSVLCFQNQFEACFLVAVQRGIFRQGKPTILSCLSPKVEVSLELKATLLSH